MQSSAQWFIFIWLTLGSCRYLAFTLLSVSSVSNGSDADGTPVKHTFCCFDARAKGKESLGLERVVIGKVSKTASEGCKVIWLI
jgi:hypothetical protein